MSYWYKCFSHGGWLKWIILQSLSKLAKPKILKVGLSTNAGFSGVLFTGQMGRIIISKAFDVLKIINKGNTFSDPIILIHPAAIAERESHSLDLKDFPLSKSFLSSPWRYKEWIIAENMKWKFSKSIDGLNE